MIRPGLQPLIVGESLLQLHGGWSDDSRCEAAIMSAMTLGVTGHSRWGQQQISESRKMKMLCGGRMSSQGIADLILANQQGL